MKKQLRIQISLLCAILMAGLFPCLAKAGRIAPDVADDAWYAMDAAAALGSGMMYLNQDGSFAPHQPMTRRDVCYALWVMAGTPEHDANTPQPFSDVWSTDWWYDAVIWAAEHGVVKGYADRTFRPSQSVTRAQMATFLCRCAVDAGYDTSSDLAEIAESARLFVDHETISRVFRDSVYWARSREYINGMAGNVFCPNNPVTRAQAAAIFGRFMKKNNIKLQKASIPVVDSRFVLSEASYPSLFSVSPDAAESAQTDVSEANSALSEEEMALMRGFFQKSIQQFLVADREGAGILEDNSSVGMNQVFSPLNVYFALSILAECGNGETRSQMLSLLGIKDVESLRELVKKTWNANYENSKSISTVFANSLWLNEHKIRGAEIYGQSTALDALKEYYYASVYRGDSSEAAFSEAFQSWLNAQTGGLLEDAALGQKLDSETAAALASTLYYRAGWINAFQASKTKLDTFHARSGDVTCAFMCQKRADYFAQKEKFSVVRQELVGAGDMWLLLPAEGLTPEDLLRDSEVMDFMLSDLEWYESRRQVLLNKSIPKFDVTGTVNLIPGLQSLGVTNVFQPQISDLTTLLQPGAYVDTASHSVRVKIDEEGCEAAAFTVISIGVTAAPMAEEEADFTLDRPFIFYVTGSQHVPLFVGIINNPASKN